MNFGKFTTLRCLTNGRDKKEYEVHKSTKHFEGDECFGGEFFIVVAILPGGQISNHYEMKDWDLFHIPAYDKVLYKYDGHTAKDVAERLRNITSRFSGAQKTAAADANRSTIEIEKGTT